MFLPLFCFLFLIIQAWTSAEFGPADQSTEGAIWPKPAFEKRFNFSFALDPKVFLFKVVSNNCSLLQNALNRYLIIMKKTTPYGKLKMKNDKRKIRASITHLPYLNIDLKSPCEEYPSAKMDESYNITIVHTSVSAGDKNCITSNSVWGIIRGLESLSQMIVPDRTGHFNLIEAVFISDTPRFPHRGLLLDTSRHFIPLPEIFKILNGMAFSKMNVFHWHIVDDQSFPFQSRVYPNLSEKGAYHPELAIYSYSDVEEVINFARDRGIRVIPEFDSPGHTKSWGEGEKGLLVQCPETEGIRSYGPVDPSKESTYRFLDTLFKEIGTLFKDDFLHVGGDEVDTECWEESAHILHFMDKHHMGRHFSRLQNYYFNRFLQTLHELQKNVIVWQEVFENEVKLNKSAIIQVWKDTPDVNKYIVSEGYRMIYSTCWYLDSLTSSWKKFYECDLLDFNATSAEKARVLGGEACMWGEMVDETNVSPRIWPRACATAERLWSYGNNKPSYDTVRRMEEHTCRLKRRGVPAEPANGPGYCFVL